MTAEAKTALERELTLVLEKVSEYGGKSDRDITPLENWDLWHEVETVLAKAQGREPDYGFHDCAREDLTPETRGWMCLGECRRPLDPIEVTYEETCTHCGGRAG